MADILAAVDWSGVAAAVTAGGVAVIGIRMLFKGTDISKRIVSKA